jgi:hypothetical protein
MYVIKPPLAHIALPMRLIGNPRKQIYKKDFTEKLYGYKIRTKGFIILALKHITE